MVVTDIKLLVFLMADLGITKKLYALRMEAVDLGQEISPSRTRNEFGVAA
jgi:hypothetical protein